MTQRKKRRTWSWLLPVVLLAVLLAPGRAGAANEAANAKRPNVVYDKASDLVSVEADNASLRILLAVIALKTGVEIEMDPAVEQAISITLKDRTLEDGLKQIAHRLDLKYAMVYHKEKGQDESATPTLVYMKIVPKSTKPDQMLEPVVPLQREAFVHSLSSIRKGVKSSSMLDHARKRWQARMDNMPEDKRKRIEEMMKKMQEQYEARLAERQKLKAKFEQRMEEKRAKRQAMDEEMKASNPEGYELRQQRREELRQKAIEEKMMELEQ